MPTVVGVSFKPVTKVYYFDPSLVSDLQAGDYVIVETSQGREVGQIVWQPREVPDDDVGGALKPVVRRATAWDMVERDRYKHKEAEVLEVCRASAAELGLPMKMVGAEYNYDGGRLVVTFTADGRIDFRDLVRALAKTFYTRIEMKQIGVRDEAKVLSGIGKCGRQLCCASWLREFNPVTIKMAKQQNLPLNPAEISGVCGRLLCCLSYEVGTYKEARGQLPKVGSIVMTPEGEGRVRKVHPLRDAVTVRVEDGAMHDYTVDELEGGGGPAACSGCARRRSRPARQASDQKTRPAPQAGEAVSGAEDEAGARTRPRSRRRRRKPRDAS